MRRSLASVTASRGLVTLALCIAGCGEQDPPEKLPADDYFPLTLGTRWEYLEEGPGGTERHFKALTDCAPGLTFESDCDGSTTTVDAVVQTSTGDSDPIESGFTYYTVRDDGFFRVRQERKDIDEAEPEVVRTYWPGFFRFPRGALEPGRAWTAEHDVCELDTTGPAPAPPPVQEHKSYRWSIDSIEPLDLGDAGTFETTVAVRRENTTSGKVKIFWFAPGIGKVLERELDGETVVTEERIVSWEIGTERCP